MKKIISTVLYDKMLGEFLFTIKLFELVQMASETDPIDVLKITILS